MCRLALVLCTGRGQVTLHIFVGFDVSCCVLARHRLCGIWCVMLCTGQTQVVWDLMCHAVCWPDTGHVGFDVSCCVLARHKSCGIWCVTLCSPYWPKPVGVDPDFMHGQRSAMTDRSWPQHRAQAERSVVTHQAFAQFGDHLDPDFMHRPARRQLQQTHVVAASNHVEPVTVAQVLHVQGNKAKIDLMPGWPSGMALSQCTLNSYRHRLDKRGCKVSWSLLNQVFFEQKKVRSLFHCTLFEQVER